jgi:cell division protein FtsZ
VDTLLVIGNDKLREIYGNLKMSEAFAHADDVLTGAAKSIAEIISLHMHVNVDFNDVKTVMKDSGVAIMGSAVASGENRSIKAVEEALNSPLLNDNDIRGARHVLLNIMSGSDDIDMDEFGNITDYIQEAAGGTAELITGYGTDPSLGDSVSVTIIATGFKTSQMSGYEPPMIKERKLVNLDQKEIKTEDTKQTNIIDEIKTNEPFVFMKEEKIETPPVINVIPPVIEEKEEITVNTTETTSEVKSEEIVSETTKTTEFIFHTISDKTEETAENKSEETVSREEQIKLAQERIRKLKEITLKMKSPDGLAMLEKETAFSRKNISLENKTPSTDSEVSRFTLSEGDDKKIEIRPNNSFLHDNVD